MHDAQRPGFQREDLRVRYDVASMREDEWHAYTGKRTEEVVQAVLGSYRGATRWLLNAGSGVYSLQRDGWSEVSFDLFTSPIRGRHLGVVGSIEKLPFETGSIGAVVCVGEVLAYCDPATAFKEFARVLGDYGLLICDFHSTRSSRLLMTGHYARAVDLLAEIYNGTLERTWIYDPAYIKSLLLSTGFRIRKIVGIHSWSALLRRLGLSIHFATAIQSKMDLLRLSIPGADIQTIIAELA